MIQRFLQNLQLNDIRTYAILIVRTFTEWMMSNWMYECSMNVYIRNEMKVVNFNQSLHPPNAIISNWFCFRLYFKRRITKVFRLVKIENFRFDPHHFWFEASALLENNGHVIKPTINTLWLCPDMIVVTVVAYIHVLFLLSQMDRAYWGQKK